MSSPVRRRLAAVAVMLASLLVAAPGASARWDVRAGTAGEGGSARLIVDQEPAVGDVATTTIVVGWMSSMGTASDSTFRFSAINDSVQEPAPTWIVPIASLVDGTDDVCTAADSDSDSADDTVYCDLAPAGEFEAMQGVTVYTGDANDAVVMSPVSSVARDIELKTELGDDNVTGSPSNDFVDGGAGNDTIFGHEGSDGITGGPGADTVDGGPGGDFLSMRDGEADASISCGAGDGAVDSVQLDHNDPVPTGCGPEDTIDRAAAPSGGTTPPTTTPPSTTPPTTTPPSTTPPTTTPPTTPPGFTPPAGSLTAGAVTVPNQRVETKQYVWPEQRGVSLGAAYLNLALGMGIPLNQKTSIAIPVYGTINQINRNWGKSPKNGGVWRENDIVEDAAKAGTKVLIGPNQSVNWTPRYWAGPTKDTCIQDAQEFAGWPFDDFAAMMRSLGCSIDDVKVVLKPTTTARGEKDLTSGDRCEASGAVRSGRAIDVNLNVPTNPDLQDLRVSFVPSDRGITLKKDNFTYPYATGSKVAAFNAGFYIVVHDRAGRPVNGVRVFVDASSAGGNTFESPRTGTITVLDRTSKRRTFHGAAYVDTLSPKRRGSVRIAVVGIGKNGVALCGSGSASVAGLVSTEGTKIVTATGRVYQLKQQGARFVWTAAGQERSLGQSAKAAAGGEPKFLDAIWKGLLGLLGFGSTSDQVLAGGFPAQMALGAAPVGNASSAQIVAGGAGNIIAGGAGNIVAGGAGNVVAGGAGNFTNLGPGSGVVQGTGGSKTFVLGNNSGIVAGGAGNVATKDPAAISSKPVNIAVAPVVQLPGAGIIAAGGGNIIAAGGGNVIAAGGGNVVASGGGNAVVLTGSAAGLLANDGAS